MATTQYDPFGRFPQWTENALAHREEYTSYNQVLSVVQSIKGINGLVTSWQHDGFSGETVQTYRYAGLRSHHLYGSLGFHHTSVTTAFAGDSRLRRSETCYSQIFPFIGLPIRRKTIGDGVLLGDSTITYEAKYFQSGSTHMAVGRLSTEISYELSGVETSRTVTSIPNVATDIDDYGNVLRIEVDTNGYKKITRSLYDNNTQPSLWHLGRLTESEVTSIAPNTPNIVRKSKFGYHPATGLLHWEKIEPGNPVVEVTTTHEYDAFGNKKKVTVSGANITVDSQGGVYAGGPVLRVVTTNHDARGRFPTDTTNALGHVERYDQYDQVLGVVLQMTGANNLLTSWQYDGMGRKVYEQRADGTRTRTHHRWTSSAPALAQPAGQIANIKYLVETTMTASNPSQPSLEINIAPPVLAFHDKMGRSVVGVTVSGTGKMVYTTALYDRYGRAYSTSNPYFGGGTAYWVRTTDYDLLDRPKVLKTPHESSPGEVTTSYSYAGLITSSTDPKGRLTLSERNQAGWTTSVTRNATALGGPSSNVTYTHDALGNILGTDAEGVVTALQYDERGRKKKMTDPSMGVWEYRYNVFGELIWQKDAKGQITTLGDDALGRLQSRSEGEGTTTWTYDSSPTKGLGKLHQVTSPGNYKETYLYDAMGRGTAVTREIDGLAYAFETAYDYASRPVRATYPATGIGSTRASTRNVFNAFGYLKEIRAYLAADDTRTNSQLQGALYWRAVDYSAGGRVVAETFGNGIETDRIYSDASGRLLSSKVAKGTVITGPYNIQDLLYVYDEVGNVVQRHDMATGRDERFEAYDGLDRLKSHRVVGGSTVTAAFDAKGNIVHKSDVGSYTYNAVPAGGFSTLPYAVGTAGAHAYAYDGNGNMLNGAGRTLTWTSFNQVRTIAQGNKSSEFWFGAGHERVKQVRKSNNVVTDTTIYVGSLYEKVTTGTLVEHKHYVMAPTGRVAVITDRAQNGSPLAIDVRYFHGDGLGSITGITDERGRVLARYTYDAWGRQAVTYFNTDPGVTNTQPSTRGYTDHEMLNDFALVHMNGRVYDPVLGRFLSSDPFVGDSADAQEYNRYSYVGNNPMNATDPSGFFKLKDALKIVAIVVASVITSGAALAAMGVGSGGILSALGAISQASLGQAIVAGAAGGFASGFAGSLLNGGSIGDAFKAGVLGGIAGGISAGLAFGIGELAQGNSWFKDYGFKHLAHGVAQGGVTEAMGGEFRHGFYAAAFTSAVAGPISRNIDGVPMQTAAAAVVGGTASTIGGGKFANGAVSGAFTYLFNDALHRAEERQQIRITKAAIEVNRIGFRNFDAKAAAVVDFVGAWESFPANRFDGLPTTSAVNSFEDAVEYFLGAGQFVGEQAGAIPSPSNYKSVTSGALNHLRNTLGRVGPFEARTIIEYQTLKQRSFLVFWSREQWVSYSWVAPVNGPHAGLFLDTKSATDAASKMLVDRVRGFQTGSK